MKELPQATWDVVVIGAGVAGSLAARQLALGGLSVLLVDKSAFPRWKVCGSCLNPVALALLASVGLGDLPDRCGAVPIDSLRLGMRRRQADLRLSGWKVLSRERLDASLIEAAVQAGAVFLPETLASLGPVEGDWRLVGLRRREETASVAGRVVLAADGLGNRVVHGEEVRTAAARIGAGVIVDHGPSAYEKGVIHMACGPEGYVGLVRLEDGRLNLAAALSANSLREARQPGAVAVRLLEQAGWPMIPDLAAQPWRGTPAMSRQRRRPASTRLLMIGDAAGYREPFTGEGMSWAMTAGVSAASLARRGAIAWQPRLADEWSAQQRHAAGVPQRLCRAITWVSHQPLLARLLIGVLGRFPGLAKPLTRE